MAFFTQLQDHSEIKLSILKNYTIPWMRKVVLNKYGAKKCLVIDGFAGTGMYGNGRKGSPIILIENALSFYQQSLKSTWEEPEIYIFLNEMDLVNFKELTKNVEQLGFQQEKDNYFTSSKFKTIHIRIENKKFEDFLSDILSAVSDGKTLIPSFCFVDPFGFSSTPFTLFMNYLKNKNSEILLNFIYEETNRFINHPSSKIKEQISNHMGLVNLDTLTKDIKELSPSDRKKLIIDTYTKNILEKYPDVYVRNFEIKKTGRTKMILFHITQNINGLQVMKETMWKHDETGSYCYDDRNKLYQLNFDEILNDKVQHIELLADEIYKNFKNRKSIFVEQLEHHTLLKTDYPATNFIRPALKVLEKKGLILNVVGRKKANSKTYPKKCRIDFK